MQFSGVLSIQRKPRFQPRLLKSLASLLALFLVCSEETWAKTSKSTSRTATENTFTANYPSKKKLRTSSSRRTRRHRRLKISRSLKPMPPLSEAPFSADIPLLRLIEEAKSQLEKESVRYFAGTGKSASRREVKLALAHFKTGELQVVSGVEQNRKLTLDDLNVRFEVD